MLEQFFPYSGEISPTRLRSLQYSFSRIYSNPLQERLFSHAASPFPNLEMSLICQILSIATRTEKCHNLLSVNRSSSSSRMIEFIWS